MVHDVYISYAASDKGVAEQVCQTLEAQGVPCWVAPRDIVPGSDRGEAVVQAITASRLLVLIFSSGANQSPLVKREVERAVSKGLAIVPLRMENVEPSKTLQYFLGPVRWLDAWTTPLEGHLTRLSEAVQQALSQMENRDALARSMQIGTLDDSLTSAGLEHVSLKPGQALFRQGEPGDSLYILEKGKVDIIIQGSDEEEHTLCTVEPVAILGEMSLLLRQPRTATAVANTEAELWKVAHSRFQEGIRRSERWAINLSVDTGQVLARRLSAMNQEFIAQAADLRQLQTHLKSERATRQVEKVRRFLSRWSH